ncbi:hypothetical protein Scep_029306 [Stephania cephalantha]|uniref:Uncharacterized protein n=1 Tax=Stephania cephalantha TaxID=152367 RepID=A0AAP0E0D7_9MAGN
MIDEDLSLCHGFLSRDVWMGSTVHGFLSFDREMFREVVVMGSLAKTIPGCRPGFSVTLHSCGEVRSTSTALELCLYFYMKDHDGVTFLDSRVENIVADWLTRSQSDTPIDEIDLYLSVVERDDKGRTYGLGWTPSWSRRKHATAGGAEGGAGGGDGTGSSRPIYSPNEPVELLRRDFQTMQTHILRVMQDHTLTQDQL